MTTEPVIAFLDESGGHGFDFSTGGTSNHFIVSSIIVNGRDKKEVEAEFLEIKNSHFPHSELKSSKIGSKDHIRQRLLEAVAPLDFSIYCLIVDKRRIHLNSGLQYKESFYKFLYGNLYNKIYRTFSEVAVVADELISAQFVESFEKYIRENHLVNLFQQSQITFSKSDQSPLLQLADLVGGSINRFCSGRSGLDPFTLLKDKVHGKYYWPEQHAPYVVEVEPGNEFEVEISRLALLRINAYLDKNENSKDKLIRTRVMFLYYLRSVYLFNSRSRFIHTQEILEHMQANLNEEIKEQYIRQQVVGPLRSEGVLIVSNSGGYKIPSTKTDVITFFNLFSKIINPMVHRLKKSHEALYQATDGQLDVLGYPEFQYLKKLMN